MRLLFNINYVTMLGEELLLNLVRQTGAEAHGL